MHPYSLNGLEGKIAVLEKQLTELKRARNSFQAICTLPSEILVQILQHLQHTGPVYDPDRPWRTYDPRWTRTMLVCHHLRQTAVGAAVLWTVLDYHNHSQTWREMTVSRSQEALLHIHGHRSSTLEYLQRAMTAHFRHVETTTVSLNRTAPSLRILKLAIYRPDLSTYTFTSQFLGGEASSLVSLVLKGCGIVLENAPLMPVLSDLEIGTIQTDCSLVPLFNLLRSAPSLKELIVAGVCLTDIHEPLDPREAIPIPEGSVILPLLRRLVIDDAPAEVAAIVRMLRPFTLDLVASVNIQTCDGSEADEDPEDAVELNINHAQVYEHWREGLVAHNRQLQVISSISFDVPYDPHAGVDLLFECKGALEASLSIKCKISTSDHCALLDHITVLRLPWHSDQFEDHTSYDSFDIYPLNYLPSLQVLVLIQYQPELRYEQAPLKAWIARRQPRLRAVQFTRCAPGTRAFMQELLAESLVEEAVWSDA
jgi:hypothetical protein